MPVEREEPTKEKRARYRKIEVRMWGDEKFRNLSPMPPCGQGLWVYLLTGPHTSAIPGLFRVGRAAMAEELDWDIEAFDEAFREAFQKGMVKADWKAKVVWVPNSLPCNKPESPNVVTSWRDSWELLPECDLKREAYEFMRGFICGLGEAFERAFHKAIVKPSLKDIPKTIGNQEQEQLTGTDKVKTLVELALDVSDSQPDEARAAEPEPEQPGLPGIESPDEPSRAPLAVVHADGFGVGEPGSNDADDGYDPAAGMSEDEIVQRVFGYWRTTTDHPRAQLGDKRGKVIKAALKMGYSPRDLCRAIQGCALTPHNRGETNGGEYVDLGLILRDEDHIDRFMRNAKAPPVAPTKKVSNEIPGWWKSDDLALQQANVVGVSGPLASESRDTWHGRIRVAMENGGKPPAPAATVRVAPPVEAPRVEMTPEQKAASRAALFGALKKKPEDATPDVPLPQGIAMSTNLVAGALAGLAIE